MGVRLSKAEQARLKRLEFNAGIVDTRPGPHRGPGRVTMSNAVARAAHEITLGEKRIVVIGLSKLDSRQPVPAYPPVTRIHAREYAELFNLDMATAYQQLKAASKTLYDRSLLFFEPDYKRGGELLIMNRMRWVGRAKYHEQEGWIELAWWPDLMKHLMGLKEQFTSYHLQQTAALRSIHSWKLLELLTRFESTGWAEYSIEDFSASMKATEKQQTNFANIRRKLIEPAVKELREKDNWLIDWKAIKAGRKVKAVRFDFKRNPQQQLPL